MELSKLDVSVPSEVGHEFEYISEANGATGVFITVIGEKSDTVKNFIRKELNLLRQKRKMREKRGKDDVELVEEDDTV